MRPPTVAGLLVIVISAITIGGIWVFGGRDIGATGSTGPDLTAVPDGPTAQVALTSNLYTHPSRSSDLVAIVPEGRTVRVTGRTDDASWMRVIYPVDSTLEGWLPLAQVVEGSAPPLEEVPDVASAVASGDGVTEGAFGDEPALADLAVSSADVSASGILTVRITNLGRATFSDSVGLRVTTAEGELVGSLDANLAASPLGPGRSAAVNTGVLISVTGLYVIEVDPANDVEESSEFNNARRVLLVGVGS